MCQHNGIQDHFRKYPAIVPWQPVVQLRYNLVCHQGKLYCTYVSKHLSMELHSWQWDDIEFLYCTTFVFIVTSCARIFFLAKYSIILVCQRLYGLNVAACNFWLFLKLETKITVKGRGGSKLWMRLRRMWRVTDQDPKRELYKPTDKGIGRQLRHFLLFR